MAVRQCWYECGSIFGMRYLFQNRGDGLGMHRHEPEDEHNVIVLKGSIRFSSRGWEGIVVKAPTIIDVLPEWHEIAALEPNTELLNLYVHGKPAAYESLPDSEKDVSYESRPLENPL